MKKLIMIIVALAIIVVAAFYFFRPPIKLPKSVTINTSNQPTLGNPKAKIHFVAFEDLKCANCMRFNVNLLPKIKKQYIDTGVAKYTVMNVAFIPGSMPAANAARCLYEQNHDFFFAFVKYVYHHQPPEEQNWATIPKLVEYASHIKGVNKMALSQCIYKSPYTQLINNNLRQGMTIMDGMVATPTLYINGVIVKPLTMKRIRTIVDNLQDK